MQIAGVLLHTSYLRLTCTAARLDDPTTHYIRITRAMSSSPSTQTTANTSTTAPLPVVQRNPNHGRSAKPTCTELPRDKPVADIWKRKYAAVFAEDGLATA